jgi:hypothetical protein
MSQFQFIEKLARAKKSKDNKPKRQASSKKRYIRLVLLRCTNRIPQTGSMRLEFIRCSVLTVLIALRVSAAGSAIMQTIRLFYRYRTYVTPLVADLRFYGISWQNFFVYCYYRITLGRFNAYTGPMFIVFEARKNLNLFHTDICRELYLRRDLRSDKIRKIIKQENTATDQNGITVDQLNSL